MSEKNGAKCLVPVCKNAPAARGICTSCYNSARVAVKDGEVTWEELIGLGLATECRKAGNKRIGKFAMALGSAREKAGKRKK